MLFASVSLRVLELPGAVWSWFAGLCDSGMMENVEVLVRGLVMQSPGLGMGSVGFQGVELLWVAVVAVVSILLVSVTRVSVVSVGWTWGSKPGQVRVRVGGFRLDDGIVTASGMFSAEILNCSADSCSEDASSSSDCASEDAEMVFIFEKKATSLVAALPKQRSAPVLSALEEVVRRGSKSLDFQEKADLQSLLSNPKPIDGAVSLARREGIQWDASPASSGSSLANPSVYPAPPLPSRVTENNASSGQWDPLLKLRIRDAVTSDGRSSFSAHDFSLPLAPVAIHGSSIATLKDDVVRVWESDAHSLVKSVLLPIQGCGHDAVTAFDVKWESKAAALGRKGGLVCIANLECAAYESCYHIQQPVVQAIHLGRSPFSTTVFTGGPAAERPGCSVTLWDSRSGCKELSMNLTSAMAVYSIRSHGQELDVRDEAASLAAHDVRMLGASPLSRLPCEVKDENASEDRWWDINTTIEDDEDIDDDFTDCQFTKETKPASATSMSSLVRTMSRNLSFKTPSQ